MIEYLLTLTSSYVFYGVWLVVFIGLLALYIGALTFDGFIAGLIVGIPIIVFAGIGPFILLLIFLLWGSMSSRIGRGWKSRFNPLGEKIGVRAWPNVIANGFWPMLSSILYYFNPIDSLKGGWLLFLTGSLAAMVADTTATEIGMLSRSRPRLISRPSIRVDIGMSGGVTLLGIMASLIAAFIIGILSTYLLPRSFSQGILILSIAIGGFTGNIMDSYIGAELQAKFRCIKCDRIVESPNHCRSKSVHIDGVRWLDNHTVNFISGLVGGLTTVAVYGVMWGRL